MKTILGENWRTTLIGYLQFVATFVWEMFLKEGPTHWGYILGSAAIALIGKFAADSKQVNEVKKDVEQQHQQVQDVKIDVQATKDKNDLI